MKKNSVILFLFLPCLLRAQTQTAEDSAQTKIKYKWGITANLNSVGVIAETYHKFCYVSENFYVLYADLVYLRKNLIPAVKTQ